MEAACSAPQPLRTARRSVRLSRCNNCRICSAACVIWKRKCRSSETSAAGEQRNLCAVREVKKKGRVNATTERAQKKIQSQNLVRSKPRGKWDGDQSKELEWFTRKESQLEPEPGATKQYRLHFSTKSVNESAKTRSQDCGSATQDAAS